MTKTNKSSKNGAVNKVVLRDVAKGFYYNRGCGFNAMRHNASRLTPEQVDFVRSIYGASSFVSEQP